MADQPETIRLLTWFWSMEITWPRKRLLLEKSRSYFCRFPLAGFGRLAGSEKWGLPSVQKMDLTHPWIMARFPSQNSCMDLMIWWSSPWVSCEVSYEFTVSGDYSWFLQSFLTAGWWPQVVWTLISFHPLQHPFTLATTSHSFLYFLQT